MQTNAKQKEALIDSRIHTQKTHASLIYVSEKFRGGDSGSSGSGSGSGSSSSGSW